MTRKSPRAFTLVELLVSIAVIGLLVALLLPAVQQSREAAHRASCRNNLKQLALALQNYHGVHRMFPINFGYGDFDEDNRGASWMQMILPYVDQGNLYARFRFGASIVDPANRLAAQSVVPVFLCPSDTNQGVMDFRANIPGTWGVQNYKICAGSNWEWGPFSPVVSSAGRNADNPDGLEHGNGLMCRNARLDLPGARLFTTRMSDITDGTSTTFAIGETVPEWCRHTWWAWFNATTATCAIPLNFRKAPDRQVAMEGDWWRNYSFLSRHPGGGGFATADGSVHFLNESIDLSVYRKLGTIQGAEVVDHF